jgi:hypothetical protein
MRVIRFRHQPVAPVLSASARQIHTEPVWLALEQGNRQ